MNNRSPSLLDANHFPFALPVARELHLVLAQLYPSGRAAEFAAARVGIETYRLHTAQEPFFLWKDILDYATPRGLLRDLIELAIQEFPNSARQGFLADLLAGATPPLPSEPRASDGQPRFQHGDDAVAVPEALLFHDDLSLPVGRLPGLIATLTRLQALLPAVCRLDITCTDGNAFATSHGTAFRIGADLLLTNWHVFHPPGWGAVTATAVFGYERDAADTELPSQRYGCRFDSLVAEEAADWAVIRTEDALPAAIPVVSLLDSGVAAVQDAAYLIQHPGGQHKRIAFVRNQITRSDENVVQYLSDTREGSSGSPVFDAQGRLIALHHAGGRPQEVAGKPPLKKNEGIAIARVRSRLAARGIVV